MAVFLTKFFIYNKTPNHWYSVFYNQILFRIGINYFKRAQNPVTKSKNLGYIYRGVYQIELPKQKEGEANSLPAQAPPSHAPNQKRKGGKVTKIW